MNNHNFNLAMVDTDAISFSKPDQSPFSKEETKKLLKEINSRMKKGIIFMDDGVFDLLAVVGAKNYIMLRNGKLKIKGSGLKATKKEPRFKIFINDVIKCIVENRIDDIMKLYVDCAKEIMDINELNDVSQWSFKATATKAVLSPKVSFNRKIAEALIRHNIDIVEGDKYYLFFKNVSRIDTIEYVNKKGKLTKKKVKIQDLEISSKYNGDICKMTLLKKLYVTLKIFKRVLDVSKYPNYTLKANIKKLIELSK